jgi:hypothetical protein
MRLNWNRAGEHPTLQGEHEVVEANNVCVHLSSCSIFSGAVNSLSSSLASSLLFRVTKDMSVAVGFLEEADTAAADEMASRKWTRMPMPRWPGPRRAPRIPRPRLRWPRGGRERARSFSAWRWAWTTGPRCDSAEQRRRWGRDGVRLCERRMEKMGEGLWACGFAGAARGGGW